MKNMHHYNKQLHTVHTTPTQKVSLNDIVRKYVPYLLDLCPRDTTNTSGILVNYKHRIGYQYWPLCEFQHWLIG